MGVCSVLVFAALGISAGLRNRIDGIHSIAIRTLFLCGICGLLVLLFFLLTSRGFRIGILPYCLVGAVVCGALLFRRQEIRDHENYGPNAKKGARHQVLINGIFGN